MARRCEGSTDAPLGLVQYLRTIGPLLWRCQGKRDEARDLLTPVYGWYPARDNFLVPTRPLA